jgi:hypothetical protein
MIKIKSPGTIDGTTIIEIDKDPEIPYFSTRKGKRTLYMYNTLTGESRATNYPCD